LAESGHCKIDEEGGTTLIQTFSLNKTEKEGLVSPSHFNSKTAILQSVLEYAKQRRRETRTGVSQPHTLREESLLEGQRTLEGKTIICLGNLGKRGKKISASANGDAASYRHKTESLRNSLQEEKEAKIEKTGTSLISRSGKYGRKDKVVEV